MAHRSYRFRNSMTHSHHDLLGGLIGIHEYLKFWNKNTQIFLLEDAVTTLGTRRY